MCNVRFGFGLWALVRNQTNYRLGFDFGPLGFNFFFLFLIFSDWVGLTKSFSFGTRTQPKSDRVKKNGPNPTQPLYFGLGRDGFSDFLVGCTPLNLVSQIYFHLDFSLHRVILKISLTITPSLLTISYYNFSHKIFLQFL